MFKRTLWTITLTLSSSYFLAACGTANEASQAKREGSGKFHMEIIGCGTSKQQVFNSKEAFCSWTKTSPGKICLEQLSPSVEDGGVGADLYGEFCAN